jgi:hypothetical protein
MVDTRLTALIRAHYHHLHFDYRSDFARGLENCSKRGDTSTEKHVNTANVV